MTPPPCSRSPPVISVSLSPLRSWLTALPLMSPEWTQRERPHLTEAWTWRKRHQFTSRVLMSWQPAPHPPDHAPSDRLHLLYTWEVAQWAGEGEANKRQIFPRESTCPVAMAISRQPGSVARLRWLKVGSVILPTGLGDQWWGHCSGDRHVDHQLLRLSLPDAPGVPPPSPPVILRMMLIHTITTTPPPPTHTHTPLDHYSIRQTLEVSVLLCEQWIRWRGLLAGKHCSLAWQTASLCLCRDGPACNSIANSILATVIQLCSIVCDGAVLTRGQAGPRYLLKVGKLLYFLKAWPLLL